jgi:hypothetical protein
VPPTPYGDAVGPPETSSRVGSLKNGNPPGRFSDARRCGAKARRTGLPCRAPACRGKRRCRMHGGTSSGPRTAAGLERSRRARWKHGSCSANARRNYQQLKAEARAFTAACVGRHAQVFGAMTLLLRQEAREARNRRRRKAGTPS